METLKRIAIDMDGVLADTDSQYLTWYYNAYGVQVPYEQMLGKPEGEGFPEKDAIKELGVSRCRYWLKESRKRAGLVGDKANEPS